MNINFWRNEATGQYFILFNGRTYVRTALQPALDLLGFLANDSAPVMEDA